MPTSAPESTSSSASSTDSEPPPFASRPFESSSSSSSSDSDDLVETDPVELTKDDSDDLVERDPVELTKDDSVSNSTCHGFGPVTNVGNWARKFPHCLHVKNWACIAQQGHLVQVGKQKTKSILYECILVKLPKSSRHCVLWDEGGSRIVESRKIKPIPLGLACDKETWVRAQLESAKCLENWKKLKAPKVD
jgi:hypothetical protein